MRATAGFQPFHWFEQELTDAVSGRWFHPKEIGPTGEHIFPSWHPKPWGEYHEFLKDPVEDKYIDVIDIVKPMIPNQEPGA